MTEAIILAGGLGTRLRSVIQDIPKPMATIQGKPFLSYLLDQLQYFGFKKVILSIGYQSQYIQNFYAQKYRNVEIVYAVEQEPLGTGGAIWNALQYTTQKDILIFNGDSIFLCDIYQLIDFHNQQQATLTMALKEAENFERYGTVILDKNHRIVDFKEKQFVSHGIFNTGIYIVDKEKIKKLPVTQKFSFEKDILEKEKEHMLFVGKVFQDYFIDIGIPEDFYKANNELSEKIYKFKAHFLKNINTQWTLFLDRDGVINKQIVGDYVRSWEQFEFLPKTLEALKILATIFSKIIIITNQQCVGKGIVSNEIINNIHTQMMNVITQQGGRIDAIFYAPYLQSENHIDRKPNIGMGLKAKEQFADIDFSKTIMIGDSHTDMQFAEQLGIKTIFVGKKKTPQIVADAIFEDIYAFAQFLKP